LPAVFLFSSFSFLDGEDLVNLADQLIALSQPTKMTPLLLSELDSTLPSERIIEVWQRFAGKWATGGRTRKTAQNMQVLPGTSTAIIIPIMQDLGKDVSVAVRQGLEEVPSDGLAAISDASRHQKQRDSGGYMRQVKQDAAQMWVGRENCGQPTSTTVPLWEKS
jgi:hypothetical protein